MTLVGTGQSTMTGGRIKTLGRLLDDTFMLTYGDRLSDIPVDKVLEYYQEQGAEATVTTVHPLPRWGALSIEDDRVVGFEEEDRIPRPG